METKGIESSPFSAPKTAISENDGAKCGALADEIDPDLAEIVRLWPDLSERNRTAIKALVEAHKAEEE